MNENYFLLAAASVGLLTGLLAGNFLVTDEGSSYCEKIESQVEANQSFNGSISCHPPGVYGVNLSDSVEGTELKCVCRKSYQGREEFLAIRIAQAR